MKELLQHGSDSLFYNSGSIKNSIDNLENIRQIKGNNILEVSLVSRPDGLEGSVIIEEMQIVINYGSYPSG